jgi:hypothetical protein
MIFAVERALRRLVTPAIKGYGSSCTNWFISVVIIKHSEVRYQLSSRSGSQMEGKSNFSGDIVP